MTNNQKICLGTAQFGQKYGINNDSAIINGDQAKDILSYAWKNGIKLFDTAISYGNSETILGDSLSHLNINDAKVYTKIHISDEDNMHIKTTNEIIKSLKKLQLYQLEGLLLHDEDELSTSTFKVMKKLKNEGFVKSIGVSFYDFNKALESLIKYSLDFIQVPFNIFDKRLLETGLLDLAKEKKVKVFTRSTFLQGLIFMSAEELSKKLDFPFHYINKLQDLSEETNMDISTLAIKFVLDQAKVDYIILGVDNIHQLKKNISAFNSASKINSVKLSNALRNISSTLDLKYISPNLW